MKYIDLVEKLQQDEINKGYIVIIKSGIFFIGIGKDALILNRLLNLKLICMKEHICKVGFQVKSVEKYIAKLSNMNNSFVIYDYNSKLTKAEEIIRVTKNPIFENAKCLDCKSCNNRQETAEEIIERLKRNARK